MPLQGRLEQEQRVAIDLEWSITPPHVFRCGAVYTGKGKVDVYTTLDGFVKRMQSLPAGVVISGHYVVSDIGKIVQWAKGYCLPKELTLKDTVIAARLLQGHLLTKSLKPLAAEYGMHYENLGTQENEGDEESDEFLGYCARDAFASYHLWPLLTTGIDERLQAVLDLNNAFQRAFYAMELAGLSFSVEKAHHEETRLLSALSACVSQFPEGLSPAVATDDNQLRAWLLQTYSDKELKLFPKTKGKGELSVGAAYIKLLDRPVPGLSHLIKARETQTFLGMYVQGKQRFLDANNFLYPSYSLLTAKTHRRTTKPSIQNWPKEAREFIKSRWPHGSIVWGDFKQLEARLFAWQCGSKQMMADLIERGYVGIASRVYGIEVQKGSDEYKLVKATVLATQYHMGAGKLRLKVRMDHGINITFKEAQAKRDKFFNTYPEIATEAERRIKYAWSTGCAWSDVGSPIPLYLMPDSYYPTEDVGFDGSAKVPWEVKQVNNFSINYPTQQLAGYVTGSALLSMQEALADDNGGWGEYLSQVHDSTKTETSNLITIPIAEVHDELVTDSQHAETTKEFLRYHMKEGLMRYLLTVSPGFDCPLDVDIESMPYWTKT